MKWKSIFFRYCSNSSLNTLVKLECSLTRHREHQFCNMLLIFHNFQRWFHSVLAAEFFKCFDSNKNPFWQSYGCIYRDFYKVKKKKKGKKKKEKRKEKEMGEEKGKEKGKEIVLENLPRCSSSSGNHCIHRQMVGRLWQYSFSLYSGVTYPR